MRHKINRHKINYVESLPVRACLVPNYFAAMGAHLRAISATLLGCAYERLLNFL